MTNNFEVLKAFDIYSGKSFYGRFSDMDEANECFYREEHPSILPATCVRNSLTNETWTIRKSRPIFYSVRDCVIAGLTFRDRALMGVDARNMTSVNSQFGIDFWEVEAPLDEKNDSCEVLRIGTFFYETVAIKAGKGRGSKGMDVIPRKCSGIVLRGIAHELSTENIPVWATVKEAFIAHLPAWKKEALELKASGRTS